MKKPSKRSIELPKGCNDIHDVLERDRQLRRQVVELRHGPIPPISRQVHISARVTVRDLAKIAEREPALVIAGLLGIGVFAFGLDREVEFEPAAMLLLTYGIEAERTG